MFDPEGETDGFVYTVNAPTNLVISTLCDDGSRMGIHMAGHMLNLLIEADAFNEHDTASVVSQTGQTLTATVGVLVENREVQAFMANSEQVRLVVVSVSGVPDEVQPTPEETQAALAKWVGQ